MSTARDVRLAEMDPVDREVFRALFSEDEAERLTFFRYCFLVGRYNNDTDPDVENVTVPQEDIPDRAWPSIFEGELYFNED